MQTQQATSTEQIRVKVKEIIANVAGREAAAISDHATLADDLIEWGRLLARRAPARDDEGEVLRERVGHVAGLQEHAVAIAAGGSEVAPKQLVRQEDQHAGAGGQGPREDRSEEETRRDQAQEGGSAEAGQ